MQGVPRELLESIYGACAELERTDPWSKLSPLHHLGVMVEDSETPYCTLILVTALRSRTRTPARGSRRRTPPPACVRILLISAGR